jgi:hypothetical protein
MFDLGLKRSMDVYNNFDLDDIILLNVHEFVLNVEFSMLMPNFVIPNLWKPWRERERERREMRRELLDLECFHSRGCWGVNELSYL